jgi:hypothetical protein
MGEKTLSNKLALGGPVIGDHVVSDQLCPALGAFRQSDTIRSRQGQRTLKTGAISPLNRTDKARESRSNAGGERELKHVIQRKHEGRAGCNPARPSR